MQLAVLGTGTDIGKTWLSCALLRRARSWGLDVLAIKPVMSGFAADELPSSDAGRLLEASGVEYTPETVEDVTLYRMTAPLAPNIAAQLEGIELDDEKIVAFCRDKLAAGAGLTLLEGAGGVLSPLTNRLLNADLVSKLNLSAILVTKNYLGAVSHTLTAIEACLARTVTIDAVIVNQPSPGDLAPQPLAEELARWCDAPLFSFSFGDEDERIDPVLDTLLR